MAPKKPMRMPAKMPMKGGMAGGMPMKGMGAAEHKRMAGKGYKGKK